MISLATSASPRASRCCARVIQALRVVMPMLSRGARCIAGDTYHTVSCRHSPVKAVERLVQPSPFRHRLRTGEAVRPEAQCAYTIFDVPQPRQRRVGGTAIDPSFARPAACDVPHRVLAHEKRFAIAPYQSAGSRYPLPMPTATFLGLSRCRRWDGFARVVLAHAPARSIVDVGCGHGVTLAGLARLDPTLRLRGFDESPLR